MTSDEGVAAESKISTLDAWQNLVLVLLVPP